MKWKDIPEEEAKKHPKYGFGGSLLIVYAIILLWCLHSAYLVFFDTDYVLARSYGYENTTMVDFTSFLQIVLALPFLYLAPTLSPIMPSVSVSLFSVTWAIWFVFGMISPLAVPNAIVFTAITLGIVAYLHWSVRVYVTYRHRVPDV